MGWILGSWQQRWSARSISTWAGEGVPLHERHDAGAVLRVAQDRVALPVAAARAVGRPRRPLRQVALPGEPAPAVIATIPFPEGLVGIPQVMPERPRSTLEA
jgi:hypothetical protein